MAFRIPLTRTSNVGVRLYAPAPISGRRDVAGQVAETEYPTVQTSYRGTILVGTPAKKFNVCFDSGSYDFWLYGNTCTSAACEAAANVYSLNNSTTGVDLHTSAAAVSYVDGLTYSGQRVNDTVSAAGIALQNFEFTQVTNLSMASTASNSAYDGILGMGFHPRDMDPVVPSFAERLVESNFLSEQMFSFFIYADELAGDLTIGGYNSELFENTSAIPIWIPMLTDDILYSGKLALPLLGSYINEKPTDRFSSHTSPVTNKLQGNAGAAIIDTGTSQAIVSYAFLDDLADALQAQWGGRGQIQKIYYSLIDNSSYTYTASCSLKNEGGGPTATFEFIGGTTISISALEYVSEPQESGNTTFCQLMFRAEPEGYSDGTYLIGNTVLKRYATIFDFEQKRIGFALGAGRSDNVSIGFMPNSTMVYESLSYDSVNIPPIDIAITVVASLFGLIFFLVACWIIRRRYQNIPGKIRKSRNSAKASFWLFGIFRQSKDADMDFHQVVVRKEMLEEERNSVIGIDDESIYDNGFEEDEQMSATARSKMSIDVSSLYVEIDYKESSSKRNSIKPASSKNNSKTDSRRESAFTDSSNRRNSIRESAFSDSSTSNRNTSSNNRNVSSSNRTFFTTSTFVKRDRASTFTESAKRESYVDSPLKKEKKLDDYV
ncbi:Type I transmembrane sorting receptor [Physocladia obscura]|uniref:Type I transmembrane sorting receptor n=1 Tax=Physocladia obscura TaxID=109957 RepID=A0AAD5SWF9_9FUNG|nr:Type I transmembrane sorting receptor [Physocladia obscura]